MTDAIESVFTINPYGEVKMPVEQSQHAIEPLTRLYLQSFPLLLHASTRRPRQYRPAEITRLYLQSLTSHVSDAFGCAPSAAHGSGTHTRDASSGIHPDTHDPDVFCNIAFGSVIASADVICWYYTPFYPKHSYGPADTIGPNNTLEISLIGDYVVRSYHNDGM